MSVKVIADSTCDLSEELLKRYDIDIIPLHIVLDDKEYRDGDEITPDEIYKWAEKNRTVPKTSAASVEDVKETLAKYAGSCDEMILFAISEKMSSTVRVMRLAAEDMNLADRVHVVDTANLSSGGGHLVIEAAIMAAQGKSAGEIVPYIEKLRPRVRASFVVDTLTYLHRGGRCGSVTALVGTALTIHPKILVKDGEMDTGRKYRGRLDKAIMQYVSDMKAQLTAAKKDRVFITHSGCDQAIVDAVYAYIKELSYFDEILVTRAGGVISSHCGPGTLGVLYIEGEK